MHLASPSAVINAGDQWNSYQITARGSRLVVVLNGTQLVDTTDDQFASGPFALQYGGGHGPSSLRPDSVARLRSPRQSPQGSVCSSMNPLWVVSR